MHNSIIDKWRPGEQLPALPNNPNPNLRLVLQAIIIVAVIVAVSLGGLTETFAGLLLSRLP